MNEDRFALTLTLHRNNGILADLLGPETFPEDLTKKQFVEILERGRDAYRRGALEVTFHRLREVLTTIGLLGPMEGVSRQEVENLVSFALLYDGSLERAFKGRESKEDAFLLEARDFMDQPPLKWLLPGVLPAGSLAALFGDPGTGKSFVALDMALSLQIGVAPQFFPEGVTVTPQQVVYWVLEGVEGFGNRIRAWIGTCTSPGAARAGSLLIIRDPSLFVTEGVRGAAGRVIEALAEVSEKPTLLVIDTLARAMVGRDENSVKDVGEFLHALGMIQRALGCTVLLIHHSRKGDSMIRGSTALTGALDTMIRCEAGDSGRKLVFEKMKDGRLPEPMRFSLLPVQTEDMDQSSCIVVPPLPGTQERIVAFMEPGKLYSAAQLIETLKLSVHTVQRQLRALAQRGLVEKVGEKRGTQWRMKNPRGLKTPGVLVERNDDSYR